MTLPQAKQLVTVEEYLRREQTAVDKHEFYHGEVFMMAGGSPDHSLAIANLTAALHTALRGKPCRVYDSNLRIRIPATTLYTYPEASVICGERVMDPDDPNHQTVLNPSLVVEVLSPSSEAYDRGAKFENYQQIESLKEYLLVAQDSPRAETFVRQSDGTWVYAAFAGIDAALRLSSLGISLELRELYDGVTLTNLRAIS